MTDSDGGSRLGAALPGDDPGAPPFLRSGLVYLTCPECNRQIKEPFNPDGGPQVIVHRHSHSRNARLLVIPAEGTVRSIPCETSMEAALADAIGRAS